MARAYAEATYDEIHKDLPYHDGSFKKWAKTRSDSTPYHYRDGVSISVHREDFSPDNDFLKGG